MIGISKSASRISHIHFIPIRRRYTCLLFASVSSDSCIGSKIMKVVYPACSIAPPESSRKEMIYAFWTLQPRPGPRWMLHPRPGPAVFWTLHPRPGPFWTLHPRPGPAFWRVHPRPGPCILIDLLGWVLVFGKKRLYISECNLVKKKSLGVRVGGGVFIGISWGGNRELFKERQRILGAGPWRQYQKRICKGEITDEGIGTNVRF